MVARSPDVIPPIANFRTFIERLYRKTEPLGSEIAPLFRVPGDALNVVGVALDREIEPPTLADARLPQVFPFAVLLGTQ